MPWQTVLRTVKKAKERGWQAGSPLTDSMLNNAPRSGRPELLQPRDNNALEEVVDIHRTLPAHALVKVLEERFSELGLRKTPSRSTLLRWLKANGYRKVKFTTKPGLNQAQKMARLDFALQVRNWDLEKWKKVVWSDETSAVLGAYRGKRSIWRRPHESHSWRSIRRRWKGFSEFMFWGCFSYDRKGPGHCWIRETAALKKKYAGIISEYNAAHEAIDRATWESEERLTPSGKKSKKKWKYTAKTGKMEVKGKGGINWIRYQHEVFGPSFLTIRQKTWPWLYRPRRQRAGACFSMESSVLEGLGHRGPKLAAQLPRSLCHRASVVYHQGRHLEARPSYKRCSPSRSLAPALEGIPSGTPATLRQTDPRPHPVGAQVVRRQRV